MWSFENTFIDLNNIYTSMHLSVFGCKYENISLRFSWIIQGTFSIIENTNHAWNLQANSVSESFFEFSIWTVLWKFLRWLPKSIKIAKEMNWIWNFALAKDCDIHAQNPKWLQLFPIIHHFYKFLKKMFRYIFRENLVLLTTI